MIYQPLLPLLSIDFVPGQAIVPLGVLIEHQTAGMGAFRDWVARFFDYWGGRVRTYETPVEEKLREVLHTLSDRARMAEADAIIGLHIAVQPVTSKGMAMLQVIAYGTAVRYVHVEEMGPETTARDGGGMEYPDVRACGQL